MLVAGILYEILVVNIPVQDPEQAPTIMVAKLHKREGLSMGICFVGFTLLLTSISMKVFERLRELRTREE